MCTLRGTALKLVSTDWVSVELECCLVSSGCWIARVWNWVLLGLPFPGTVSLDLSTARIDYNVNIAQVDLRCQLVRQKMNPSHTYTPRVRQPFSYLDLPLIARRELSVLQDSLQ